MEALNKKNRKELLGSNNFLEDGQSLTAKVNYQNGIEYFDTLLKGRSTKDFKANIHIEARKKGLEIILARLFKSNSVAIPYVEIKNIFLTNANSPQIIIELEEDTIVLYFNSTDMTDVSEFFYKYCHSKFKIKKSEQNEFRNKYPYLEDYKRKPPTHKLEFLQVTAFIFALASLLVYFIIGANMSELVIGVIVCIILAIRIISAILCNEIAGITKRNQLGWLIFSFVVPILSLIIIAFMKSKDKEIAEELSKLNTERKISFYFGNNE